jgi:hypothetical protein
MQGRRVGEWANGRVGVSACRRRARDFAGNRAAGRKEQKLRRAGYARGASVGFAEPNAWRVAALRVGRSGGSQPPKGFPGKTGGSRERLGSRQSYLLSGMARVVDRPIEQNTP